VAVHQAFGAAVAAARLLRLAPEAFANAFGLAGALSTVPAARKWNWRDRPLFSFKDVVAAPAEAGVKAALFAAEGLQGSRDVLDGRHGFWIMAGSDRQDASRLTSGLGSRWTVEELSFKPYPACRWVHAALEACEHILHTGRLTLADIASVEVGTFADVVENFASRRPPTMIDAEFSMPWTVAMVLADVPKGPDWYAAGTLADPRLHAVADMVALVVDEEAQARHFSDERKSMSVVRIAARDGRRFEKRVAVARGGLASPWPDGGIEEKFREQASAVIGAAAVAKLAALVLSVDDVSDLGELFALIGGAGTP
ncbi:MAG: MmgE/PrpD family protein, partial [Alphaproteobacteria bacterium]|nr:MmgE/PrpD family protein [Alphaproteobacteria bacterium]